MAKKSERNLIEDMLVYLSDSNHAKQSNSEYENFSAELKSFLDEIPGGFLIYRAEPPEKIIYANKALLKIFCCKNEKEFAEHTGNTFKGIVHPDDYERIEDSIGKQIIDRSGLDYVEYRIIRRDGEVRWIEDYGHFIHTKSLGDIYYVFMSDATDKISKQIVERADLINRQNEKEQELRLIKSEHLRRLEVIEALSVNYDSIVYVDLDSDVITPYRESSRFAPIFAKTPGIGYCDFMAEYIQTYAHPDDRELIVQSYSPDFIKKTLENRRTFYKNYRCVEDGKTKYLQLRMVNVGNGKEVTQLVIGIMNVTEEVQQDMVQNQILQDALSQARLADITRNTFLSNVSHDMRTPLNAIFGFTELAKKNLGNPELIKHYVEKTEEAGRRILDQIDKVLQVSYMQSHSSAISESECSLNAVIQDVTDVLSVEAKKKNIAINVGCAIKHDRVYTDAEKLRQVLMHIGNNAVKYTNSGGKVEVSVAEKDNVYDGYVTYVFKVKDNGVGISEDFLQRIFNPFERERNSTHSGVFGAGLGLTISKRIVELMGGSITIKSKVGKGSEFTVTVGLKVCFGENSQNGDSGDPYRKIKGKRALIVEDNELNLEIETEILTDLGVVCETAENGKIALEKIKAAEEDYYSFVVMDIQMPVMDGWQATREIRAIENSVKARIPIIALSANAFESDKQNSAKAGMNAHLNKPINVDEFIAAVNKLL